MGENLILELRAGVFLHQDAMCTVRYGGVGGGVGWGPGLRSDDRVEVVMRLELTIMKTGGANLLSKEKVAQP